MQKLLLKGLIPIFLIFTSFTAFAVTVSYSGSPFTYYNGTPITNLTPTPGGGTGPYSYTVSSLPAGLSINASTGVISGTPTVQTAGATYTVTIRDALGATGNANLNMTVDGITYSGSPFTYYQGTAITNVTPTKIGTSTGFTISPALPTGLVINASTGVISGTPSVASSATNYTITVTFSSGPGGTANYVVNIATLAPTISYSSSAFTYYKGTAISSQTPTKTGTPSSYSISPSLPTGLAFNTGTGVISGTPTASNALTAYTITANYAGGVTATTNVNITVDGFAYTGSPFTYYTGTAISALNPVLTGDTPTSYSVSPALPAGLALSTTTGIISGTPSAVTAGANYTVTANYSSGSSTAIINITTLAPTLTYAGTPFVFYNGTAIANQTPTVTGSPSGYSVSPALPVGLALNTTTGVISGTPTAVTANANYVVTATYTGGVTATRTISIAIDGINYAGSPFTYFAGTAIANLTPTSTGAVTAFAVSPALPAGLTLNTSTGVISGTPTTGTAAANYVVTATFAGGTASATINITVTGNTISYSSSTYTFYKGTIITNQTPTKTGTPTSYGISPALPAGLNFNITTGVISGTPTAGVAATNYTITANYNAGATATVTLNITVEAIAYTGSPFAYHSGTTISSLTPIATGDTPTGFTVSPALPSGLAINAATGVISGTPTTASAGTNYTITATYAAGSTTARINITVSTPTLTYSTVNNTFYIGVPTGSITPIVTGTPTSYSVSPAVPAGLTFNTSTGILSGTPTVRQGYTVYTVTANFSAGITVTRNISITIDGISYTGSPFTYYQGTAIANLTPARTGTVSSYAISPSLPAGLSMSTSTGVISGTPTGTSGATTYTITATFAGGTSTASINITVLAPTFTYSASSYTYFKGVLTTTLIPIKTGTPSSYTISPALPTGLAFSTTTGNISGTPTVTSASTNYTITAKYGSVINVVATVNFTVDGIVYTGSPFTYRTGTAISSLTPATVGTTSAYSASPTLPAGLTLNTSTGVISGTPTAASGATNYTITATFAGGSSTAVLRITVSGPTINYAGSPFTYYLGVAITTLTPTVTGTPTSFGISPALSAGLSFNTSTGVISGTPTAKLGYTVYTITANYTGGVTATKNIGVTVDGITYAGSPFTYYKGTAIATLTPSRTGTATAYSVSPTLPAGLSLNTTTAVITGTPTSTSSSTNYIVTATYPGGSSSAVINITVVAPTISYTGSPFAYYTGAPITNLTPTKTGTPTSYTVSPTLPAGLAISAATGVISGDPTAATSGANYTITAHYGAITTATATINITVTASTISYSGSPFTYYNNGTAISSLTPAVTGTTPTTYTVTPALPAGLSISSTTGAVSGTPTAPTATATYAIKATYGAGVTSTTNIGITVNGISYPGSPFNFVKNVAITPLTPVKVGSPTAYSISPALPAGVTMSTTTGVISGTPTVASTSTNYTITATFSGPNNAFAVINIAVSAPTINYASAPFTFYQGSSIGTVTPVTAGGTSPYSYSTASLPTGLSLNTSTGAITGTPTTITAVTPYTVTVTDVNSLSGSQTFNITVAAPSISYAGTPFTYNTGATISSVIPVVTGTPSSYSISPSLPAGLTFDTTTGIVDGTLSAASTATNYTITANYAGGVTATSTINITVVASTIAYSGSPFTYYSGAAISSLTPITTGTTPASYSVSPTLPTGLAIDNTTGIISGTPTAGVAAADYTVTATYSAGVTTTAIVNITVIVPSISFAGSPFTYFTGTPITTLTPTISGTPTTYAISPSLPTGLAFDFTSGIISGTPTATNSAANYTVTVTYPGGVTANTIINITVSSATLSYSASTYTFYSGADVGTLTPVTNGSPSSYSVSPSLPTGLNFDTTTGIITGSPSVTAASANYTITATYSGGITASSVLNITVAAPTISYAGSPLSYLTGNTISSLTPTVTGSPTSFVITPALPTGLSFDVTTGIISGVATASSPATDYTITSTNDGFVSAFATINITVVASSITYTGSPLTYYSGAAISALTPVVTGSASSFSISPSLPAGLSFDPTTAIISGTPTTTNSATDYTITANYPAGVTAAAIVNITVVQAAISYLGSPFNYYGGATIATLMPSVVGTPTGFSISPSLPSGLALDGTTGYISGIPLTATPAADYTVTANFSGGINATATVNITITAPIINYTASAFTYYLGTAITPISPTATGTPASYSIIPTLSAGLSFDSSTGIVSGTPTATNASTNYTLIANYSSGVIATTILNITVNGPLFSWTGNGSDSNWNNLANWTSISGTLPGAGDDVAIPNTVNQPTVNVASSVASLTIAGNTTINLAAPLTVGGGIMVNNGDVIFSGTSSASFAGASSIAFSNSITVGNSNTISFNSGSLTIADGDGVNNNVAITNNGTVNLYLSTLNEGTTSTIANFGNFNILGSTVTLSNPISGYSLTNAGNITANNQSVITLNDNSSIYNTTVFLAGGSNSAITLNLSGNTSSIINEGSFVLAPTSIINLSGTGSAVSTDDASGAQFILSSDANNSASIGQISATSAGFTGKYFAQRYITGNNSLSYRSYRLLSSPVNSVSATSGSANYIDWSFLNQNFTPAYTGIATNAIYTGGPGGAANGFTFANANPLIYVYNETINPTNPILTFTSGKNVGVSSISGTTLGLKTNSGATLPATTQLAAGNGLLLYYLGSTTRSSTSTAVHPDNALVTYKGYLNQANIQVNLWYTPEAGTVAGTSGNLSFSSALPAANYPGYNLVGNPYASTIDLNQVYSDNSNSSGFTTFYELSNVTPQAYVSYNANTGAVSSPTYSSRYVESGQGFFVVANAAGQSLTFSEDQKVSDTTLLISTATNPGLLVSKYTKSPAMSKSISLKKHNQPASGNQLSGLHLMMRMDSVNFHETGIYFSKDWTDKFDKNDALDMDGISPKVFMSSFTKDGYRSSINSMDSYTDGKKIKLYVDAVENGSYNLSMTDIANIDTSSYNVFLIDNYKKDSVDLVHSGNYSFVVNKTDASTFGSDRFILAISRKITGGYELLSFSGVKDTKGVLLSWLTNNEGNYTGFEVQKLDAGSNKFSTIYGVESDGSGNYNYTDANPYNGANAYRLAQTGINGITTYSAQITINYGNTAAQGAINIYPNPVYDVVNVDFSSITVGLDDNFTVDIYNSMGLLIVQKSVNGKTLSQDVNALQTGTYIVQVKSSKGVVMGMGKFIKH